MQLKFNSTPNLVQQRRVQKLYHARPQRLCSQNAGHGDIAAVRLVDITPQHTLFAGSKGVFGELKGLFSADQPPQAPPAPADSAQSEQQQQQQQQQTQQQQRSSRPGTPAAPEFPPFTTIKSWKQGGQYDLRLYDVYPVVEVDYERREQGYLALGSYQDGANDTGSKFGFTQPIVMCYYPEGRKVMQTMVGSPKSGGPAAGGNSISSLPAPVGPGVRLNVSGGELVAVLYFDGNITPQTAEAARQKLLKALQADGIALAAPESAGFFRVGQYGAVHTLEQRVNEMLLTVEV